MKLKCLSILIITGSKKSTLSEVFASQELPSPARPKRKLNPQNFGKPSEVANKILATKMPTAQSKLKNKEQTQLHSGLRILFDVSTASPTTVDIPTTTSSVTSSPPPSTVEIASTLFPKSLVDIKQAGKPYYYDPIDEDQSFSYSQFDIASTVGLKFPQVSSHRSSQGLPRRLSHSGMARRGYYESRG